MPNTEITLYDMLVEMGTWLSSTPDELERTKKSGITNRNNRNLKSLVTAWEDGNYDDDPEILHQELLCLIPQNL